MDKKLNFNYVRRTQKDYSMSLKLSVVREIESGELSVKAAREKSKVRLLEMQLKFQQDKAIMFDMMIDIAEKELNIPIRKKSVPEASSASRMSDKKR
jgi:hypothetical protein